MPYLIFFFSFITLIFEGCGEQKTLDSSPQENPVDVDIAIEAAKNRIAFEECMNEGYSPNKVDDLAKSYQDKCTSEELKGLNARFQCTKNACMQFFKPADQVSKQFAPAMKACPKLENIRDICKHN